MVYGTAVEPTCLFAKRMSDQDNSSFQETWASNAATEANVSTIGAPVLSRIHVSCHVTAANHATPVFKVLSQLNCIRLAGEAFEATADETTSSGTNELASLGNTMQLPAEWKLHTVSSSTSPSHAIDFFTDITQPALRSAQDGINANIVVWGVHPTQKSRLLFGKSVNEGGLTPQPEMPVDTVVELFGQLVGMLHAFFSHLDLGIGKKLQDGGTGPWRLGISSWIIANNQAIDLLKAVNATGTSALGEPLAFVTMEAPSLAAAFRIVQIAKTNRIVRKQNAETAHFFVRLALFRGGQVSTVHYVDLIDLEARQDHVLIQETLELYKIFEKLKQPSKRTLFPPSNSTEKMLLSKFLTPLLTANAKTFLYANITDSRTRLRECVQMLNVVTSLQGFGCVCKPLRGVPFEQLCFEACSNDSLQELQGAMYTSECRSVVLPQSTINQARALVCDGMLEKNSFVKPRTPPSSLHSALSSEAISWLTSFALRKRDILGGSVDTIDAISSTLRIPERPLPTTTLSSEIKRKEKVSQRSNTTHKTNSSLLDRYEQLRESLDDAEDREPSKVNSSRDPHSSHQSPLHLTASKSHTQHSFVDQSAQSNEFTQTENNESTAKNIGGLQLQQQLNENLPFSLTSLANNCSELDLSSCDRKVSYVDARPEIDCVDHAVLSTLAPPTDPYMPMNPSTSLTLDHMTSRAFEKAGISPRVMEAPNVDGLDIDTVKKIQAADATLLRKNYDALLSVVREQQQAKNAAETRATEAFQNQEEMRTMFEVQIENMKLENVRLRSKLRAVETHTSLSQLFEQYEQELGNLHAQILELQAENVALELKTSGVEGVNMGPTKPSLEYKKKYHKLVEEKLTLEREVMEYRKKERQHQVHSRLADESTRRVDQLSRDLNLKEEVLVATRLSKQRLSAEMNQALEKVDKLHHENEKLLAEKAVATEELVSSRMYLASLELEKKKTAMLDRFVEKHGDRMSKLGRNGRLLSRAKSEDWRRNQDARDCEDKLLAAVKRSLPQAVPLCNKLLRRLELQELSLREFSEREVDFINLLVELVSDQPTNSLKQMIEQEMTKLNLLRSKNNEVHR